MLVPSQRETRFRDLCVSLLFGFFLRFPNLPRRTRGPIDHTREFDHRIFRRGHCGGAAFVHLLAKCDVFQFRPLDHFGGAGGGRFAGQNLFDQRILRPEAGRHIGERIGQGSLLDIFVDRFAGEEVQLERLAVAVAELRETFAVWFRPLIAGAQDAPRILEQGAVESARRAISGARAAAESLEVIIDRQDLGGFFLRFLIRS